MYQTLFPDKGMSYDEFKQVCSLIKHRGPDNSKYVIDDGIFFGFHRLSINDTSELGNQPFRTDDSLLICNGEIYNSDELTKKYNLPVVSKSDCEVIIHLYEKLGSIEHVLMLLDGVFAFVLYDKINKLTYIARDPFGVRSLYIGYTGDNLDAIHSEISVASELRCLERFSTAVQFPPNHYSVIDDGCIIYRKYPSPLATRMILRNSPEKKIYNLLDAAVKKRLHSDRPIGCLLSGGLDSSVIAYLLSTYIPNLNTYSIGLSADSPDLQCARIVAESIGSNHHELILPASEFLDAIPKVIEVIESYDTTTVRASVPMYLLCKYISENSDDIVIFSGEGSDELLGGYIYFHNAPNANAFQEETKNLLDNIHYFDGLRSDKCISRNKLEARIPFLDRDFVSYVFNLPPELKIDPVEKMLLRKAFHGKLPDSIIYRKKEAFSDGVSTPENSWYLLIQDYVNRVNVSTTEYIINPPALHETRCYRDHFELLFPGRSTVIPGYWLPKWNGDVSDPSARVLDGYNTIKN